MNNSDIELKIISEIAKTEKNIEDYKELTKPIAPDCAIGRITRMDAINNKSVIEASLRQAEEKLKKLKIVQSKLGSSEFGVCVKCKKNIPLGRILIRPESIYCVNCAN